MAEASLDTLAAPAVALLYATCAPGGTVLHRNEAWRGVFGRDARAPWKHLAEDDLVQVHQSLDEAAHGSLVTHQLVSVQLPDRDEPLPVLLQFLPVHAGPEHQKVQAITVTGEVLAEPMSWTSAQTRRHRFETIGRMAMGIAHDFNNLLSGIIGYAELLKGLDPQREPEIVRRHVDTIEKAALDGAALTRKIQQYMRQEKETRFEQVDLADVVEDTISLTRPYWYNEPRRRGIAIEVEVDDPGVPPVMGSPTELREVLINLTLNAVQAMPEGGQLTFRLGHDAARGAVLLDVEDTGTGMSPRTQERLFEPLFTTKGDQGSGMGLAVAYGIIQEHDGSVVVASALGRGTQFTLAFPAAEPGYAAAGPATPQETPRSARLLVVDDEPMVRSVLEKLLRVKGHDVRTVASGAEALAVLRDEDENAFDLVFTDHAMPGMNGQQLAEALRREHADLPLVLLTGDTDVEPAAAHVDAVLGKPFQIEDLQAVIRKLVG